MKLLLDTHIFIWWADVPERLSDDVLSALEDRSSSLLLSVASMWEMQVKTQLGKLRLSLALGELVESQQKTNGISVLPIMPAHVLALETLPTHHKDPFNRLLIAQAIVEGATLVTVDPKFARYPAKLLT